MIEWKECALKSICSRLSSGKGISAKLISENDVYPVYGGNGIRGFTNTSNFKGECAIVGRQGAYCGNVRYFRGEAYMTEHAVVICANEDNCTRYLSYLLTTMNLRRLSGQSAQPGLSVKTLGKQKIRIPDKKVQMKCAELLGSLDEKIIRNEKINKNLEEQAKAIYQKMFIDNPDNDWNEGSLSDIANITMGQSPSGSSYNDDGIGTVFFQGRTEFGFRFPTIRLYTTNPKRMAGANDILMSVRAPVGDLNIAHEDCCIGRGLAAICSKTSYQSFILYTMFSLKKQLNVFNGEGTVFGSINRNSLNDMPILIPSDEQIEKFELIVAPMDAAIRNNYDEICRLQVVRDSLLTRLMSGKIDVSNLNI